MPPTGTSSARRSSRKKTVPKHQLPQEEPPTPSRSAKRKRPANGTVKSARTPSKRQKRVEDEEAQNESDDATEIEEPSMMEAAEEVIPLLYEADEPVAVSEMYANDKVENQGRVEAFAKICGRTWTYYVTGVAINVGRASEAARKGDIESKDDEHQAHIDLGPSKHVSRTHAKVFYNSSANKWQCLVISRNGLKVNDESFRADDKVALKSGDVIEVSGTEMIFILPQTPAVVHERYLRRLQADPDDSNVSLPRLNGQSDHWSSDVHAHPSDLPLQAYRQPTHISPYGPAAELPQQGLSSSSEPNRATTPIRSLMAAPYLAQNAQITPTFNPGTRFMESNEALNYKDERCRDVKPPMSYATLIAQAILAGNNERQSLSGIYQHIMDNYAYYRYLEAGWQNSIRHNLSLNPAFVKVARESYEPGKGGMWIITPDKKEDFRKQGFKMTSRGGARQPNSNSSPSPKKSPPKREHSYTAGPSPLARTPPHHLYGDPSQPINQTPNRPYHNNSGAVLANHIGNSQLYEDGSPLPGLRAPYLSQNAQGQTPMLNSGPAEETPYNFGFYTPLPRRQEHKFGAPSTSKLPSQYLPPSSPAFWTKGLNSSPVKLGDTSPIKLGDEDANGKDIDLPTSSSPPRDIVVESPSRRPANMSSQRERRKASEDRNDETVVMNGPSSSNGLRPLARRDEKTLAPVPSVSVNVVEEKTDDGQLDLMGSFPRLGKTQRA